MSNTPEYTNRLSIQRMNKCDKCGHKDHNMQLVSEGDRLFYCCDNCIIKYKPSQVSMILTDADKSNNWTQIIDERMPPVGQKVDVKTIFGFEDTGIWDGKKWIDDEGKWRGDREEVLEWRFIRK
jgi:hypothetical protein